MRDAAGPNASTRSPSGAPVLYLRPPSACMHGSVIFEGAAARRLERVRGICLAYPESHEVEQFGHPWFKAGRRPFCVVGLDGVVVDVAFATSREDQEALCAMDARFTPTPYLHQHGWTTLRLEGDVDWGLVEELVETGYRRVALERMVRALEARGGPAAPPRTDGPGRRPQAGGPLE